MKQIWCDFPLKGFKPFKGATGGNDKCSCYAAFFASKEIKVVTEKAVSYF